MGSELDGIISLAETGDISFWHQLDILLYSKKLKKGFDNWLNSMPLDIKAEWYDTLLVNVIKSYPDFRYISDFGHGVYHDKNSGTGKIVMEDFAFGTKSNKIAYGIKIELFSSGVIEILQFYKVDVSKRILYPLKSKKFKDTYQGWLKSLDYISRVIESQTSKYYKSKTPPLEMGQLWEVDFGRGPEITYLVIVDAGVIRHAPVTFHTEQASINDLVVEADDPGNPIGKSFAVGSWDNPISGANLLPILKNYVGKVSRNVEYAFLLLMIDKFSNPTELREIREVPFLHDSDPWGDSGAVTHGTLIEKEGEMSGSIVLFKTGSFKDRTVTRLEEASNKPVFPKKNPSSNKTLPLIAAGFFGYWLGKK